MYRYLLILIALTLTPIFPLLSQTPDFDNPGDYADYLIKRHNFTVERNFDFYTYSVHEQDLQKANQRRQEVIAEVEARAREVEAAPAWEGDESLRNSVGKVIGYHLSSLREDYVNIWELRMQSSNSSEAMEKYFEALNKLETEARQASEELERVSKAFAEKNKLRVAEEEQESLLSRRIEQVNQVNQYYRSLFLTYFTAAKVQEELMPLVQEERWNEAKDMVTGFEKELEQLRQEVQQAGDFDGDDTYREVISEALDFFSLMASEKYPQIIKVGLTPDTELTQEDVNAYNEAIQYFNENGARINQKVNETGDAFLKKHIPKPVEKTKL